MASEIVEKLHASFEAWNRRDWDGAVEHISEDVIWRGVGGGPDLETTYEGHAGMRRFFSAYIEPWERISIELEEVLHERDDLVLCAVRIRAVGRDGIEVERRFLQLYRFDERRLVREFGAFGEEEEDEARRAAGLGS